MISISECNHLLAIVQQTFNEFGGALETPRTFLCKSINFSNAMVNAFFISDSEYCFSQLALPPPADLVRYVIVQRCHMLRVSGAFDVLVCGLCQGEVEELCGCH